MSGTTHCKKCGDRIWREESASRTCWVSKMNGSWCVNKTSHEPENETMLEFNAPDDAAMITAELLIVSYINEDGNNSYMVQARGEMPASTYLGMTVLAQDDIKEWGKSHG